MEKERYFLSRNAVLKWLETPGVYHIQSDELYEADLPAFNLLKKCALKEGCVVDDREFLEFCITEDLLTDRYITGKKIPARQSAEPSLRYLELQINRACNLRCRHCYLGDKDARELEVGMAGEILREFERMQGLRVLITGGEPLLHSHFETLNAMLPEFEFRKVLFTNGTLVTRSLLKRLKIDEIQVSIDGLEDSHDFLRGKGSFLRAMTGIRNSLDAGFPVSISTMVHSGNLNDFEEMERMVKSMGIKDWTVDVPCLSGCLLGDQEILPPPDVAAKYMNLGFGEGLHGGGEGYACGMHLMCVMPDGRAAKCGFFSDDTVGHAAQGLEACWKRIRHIGLSELKCDCEFIKQCRGGCRYRAAVMEDIFSKDPYRCAAMHALS
jgi:radical SAM protein with 4Fe4S-binding SPASM domain